VVVVVRPDFIHIIWSLVAFYIWVYAASDTFKDWSSPAVYNFLPTLLVILATFVIPYFYRPPIKRNECFLKKEG